MRSRLIPATIASLVVAGILAACSPAVDQLPVRTLPPCEHDEVTPVDCYWDAARMGNGQGRSFIVFDGVAYYPAP